MQRKEFINKKGEVFSYLSLESSKADTTLFFYHATGFNAETYKILLEKFYIKNNKLINFVALDQRGHGLSTACADYTNLNSWACYVEDSLEFIDTFNTKLISFFIYSGFVTKYSQFLSSSSRYLFKFS